MGGHVLLEEMSFRSICLMGDNALYETCLMGGLYLQVSIFGRICSYSAEPIRQKIVMWSPCDHYCCYPYMDVVMGVIWPANNNVNLCTCFFQATTSQSYLLSLTSYTIFLYQYYVVTSTLAWLFI